MEVIRQMETGLGLLRVVTGIVFAVHGYQKFFMMGLEGTAGFFGQLGIPLPAVGGPGAFALDRNLGGSRGRS
jgi:putative oxidoreductase